MKIIIRTLMMEGHSAYALAFLHFLHFALHSSSSDFLQ